MLQRSLDFLGGVGFVQRTTLEVALDDGVILFILLHEVAHSWSIMSRL